MKTLRLTLSPTRNRRMNEILGVLVLAVAALLLLALASYTPSDPSFDTVGGQGVTIAHLARPAHNWTGLVGAYTADAMLQLIGLAAFFLPLLLVRFGVCWLRSRPAGSPWAKAPRALPVAGLRSRRSLASARTSSLAGCSPPLRGLAGD